MTTFDEYLKSYMKKELSLDVAISIIGAMRIEALKTSADDSKSEEERVQARIDYDLYSYEEKVIYGMEGTKESRLSVFDKVNRLYAPIIKALNEVD